jgi:threonine synthase
VADSISSALPRDRIKAMRAVNDSDGAFVTVSDEAILAAIPALASTTGVFAEPAAAAVWAGVERAVGTGLVASGESVVALSTGTGLKDVPAAMRAVSAAGLDPHRVPPDLDAVAETLEESES